MKVISFGTCSYNIIYPLIIIVVISTINKFKGRIESVIQQKFYFTKSIGLMFLAEMVAGCLYFVSRYKKNSKKIQEKQLRYSTTGKVNTIFPQYKNKYTKTIIMLILLSEGVCDLTSSIIYYVSYHELKPASNELVNTMMSFQFFVYILLSIIILHQQIYLHHYTSIGI